MASLTLRLYSPMLLPLSGLIGGILLSHLGAGFVAGAVLIMAGIVVYEIIARKSGDPVAAFHMHNWHYSWVAVIFTGIGVIITNTRMPEPLPDELVDCTVMAYGHVDEVRNTTLGDRAVMELTALMDSSGNAKAISPVRILGVCRYFPGQVDDNVIFPCKLKRISDSGNTFDSGYATRIARKGILYTAIMDDSIKTKSRNTTLNGLTWNIRSRAEEFIEKTPLTKQTQNFLITIILGDREYLDENTRALFADGGVSHMLALSGMHVSIIAGIILWLLFPFNLLGIYRWRYIVALPVLWGYTFITGLTPSTVRAAIMLTTVIVCMLTERKNSSWNALLLAVFIILLFNPDALFDIGLQLSFICVTSLIFFAGPLNPIDHHEHSILFNVVAAVLVTLSATAASWVLTSYYFGIFPLLFIPANLIALPLLPIYVVLALIFMLTAAIGHPFVWLAWTLDAGYSGLVAMLSAIHGEESSALQFDVSWITVTLWLLALAGLALWLHYRRHRGFLILSAAVAVISLILIPFAEPSKPDGFIIQTRSDMPQILSRIDRREFSQTFKPNAVSGITIHGKHILSADCDLQSMLKPDVCDIAIITRSCRNSIAEIDSILHPGLIVLHPSIRRVIESEMIHQADSLHIPVHSLRISGPLHIIKE